MTETNKPDTHQQLQRLADRITVILQGAGLELSDVQDAFAESFSKTETRHTARTQNPAIDPNYAATIGAMLAIWRSDPTYVDDMGDYLWLPASGPKPSIETLYSQWAKTQPKIAASLSRETLVQLFTEGAMLEQSDNRTYRPTQSWFDAAQDHSVHSLTMIKYLSQFACTLSHAVSQVGGGQPHLVAHVNGFPNDKLPVLNNMVRTEGVRLLETVDSFLEAEKLPPGDTRPTSHAGIAVFMFYEDDPL